MAKRIDAGAVRSALQQVWDLAPVYGTARAIVLGLDNALLGARTRYDELPEATKASLVQTKRDLDRASDRFEYYMQVLLDPDFRDDANPGELYPWAQAVKVILEGGGLGDWDPDEIDGRRLWPLAFSEVANVTTLINQIMAVAGDWAEDIPGPVQRWWLQWHAMPFLQALRASVELLSDEDREALGVTAENIDGAVQFVAARTEDQQAAVDEFVEDATTLIKFEGKVLAGVFGAVAALLIGWGIWKASS